MFDRHISEEFEKRLEIRGLRSGARQFEKFLTWIIWHRRILRLVSDLYLKASMLQQNQDIVIVFQLLSKNYGLLPEITPH